MNRVFVLSFENVIDRTIHTKSYLPTVEIKDYNLMINGIIFFFFDQPVKDMITLLVVYQIRIISINTVN